LIHGGHHENAVNQNPRRHDVGVAGCRQGKKIEASTAMRKLVRIGYESYVGNLYRQGKVTLRDAAALLDLNQIETLDLFLEAGISGNLDASDILTSLEKMEVRS